VTDAPTFIWCHDLQTQGAENHEAYDKHLCLTEFHKNYTMAMKGVPSDKIVVTRNGINLEKFPKELPAKNPLKCVFMSSPDRGLEYSMLVVDRMREMTGEAFELHVYYGFDNLYKFGMAEKADQLKKMASERPWVHLHGFTEQKKLYQEVADAALWIHPANFIETFAITALEMLMLRVFPITRFYGALQNTLGEAEAKGHAVLVKNQHFNAEAIQEYADRALEVWRDKRWESIDIDMAKHDWHRVAEEWVKFLGLE
jgi:glycosyltransferase involved in cell wall biosynthesis